jgi:2'-5' RNA ligase
VPTDTTVPTDATVRLFVAADPSPDASAHLARFVGGLEVARPTQPGQSTRLADPSRWHVTLAFIGEVAPDRVDAAATALARCRADGPTGGSGRNGVRSAAEPIRIRVAGGGRFGRRRFTVLWAGLAGDTDALAELADAVRRELRRARVPFDRKPFRPHLTLARPGDRLSEERLGADLAALDGYVGPEWTVDAVHLYSSELGPKPRYERLASVALA